MIRQTRIPAIVCTCEECGHWWYSIAKKLPEACANLKCRSRKWNGKKKRIAKPKIELPKPKRTRLYDAEDF